MNKGFRPCASLALAIGLALWLCPAVAVRAQATSAAPDLKGRTGPNAAGPAAPAFASPAPGLAPALPAVPATPAAPAPNAPAVSMLLSDLRIATDPAMAGARARSTWRPAVDRADRLVLDVRPHEPLDGAWVRRQFRLNGLIGAMTNADRVSALVLLINQTYALNGYVNSGLLVENQDWPSQGGILSLRLVAGRVTPATPGGPVLPVSFVGDHRGGLRPGFVRDRMEAATRAPLNAIDLERDFRLLADDPAIRAINAQLTPGAHPGEANLALLVSPQPRLDIYASAANSRSPTVGGIRAAVGGSLRNALFSGDLLSAEGGWTSGLGDAVVSYVTPFVSPRTLFTFRAAFDDAAVIEPSLRVLDVRSSETDFEGGFSRVLVAEPLTPRADGRGWRPAESLIVGFAVAERYSTSSLLGEPFSFAPGAVDGRADFTVLRAIADWVQRGEREVIAVSTTASFGLRGSGGDLPLANRVNPQFHAVMAQANYARRLTAGGLELRARLAGQWADSRLYSPEELSAGGQTTVRGYRENQVLTDTGLIGSLELSCPIGLRQRLCAARGESWRTVRASVFFDGATMKNHFDPQPGGQNLASVGASLTWSPLNALFVRVTYGDALIAPLRSGARDLQDDGFSFEVTLHPLALWRR